MRQEQSLPQPIEEARVMTDAVQRDLEVASAELGLTHSALARLVGARRPSVTSALGDLGRDRLLERTEDGWLLRGDPAHLVDPVTERLLSPA